MVTDRLLTFQNVESQFSQKQYSQLKVILFIAHAHRELLNLQVTCPIITHHETDAIYSQPSQVTPVLNVTNVF